MGVVLGGYLVRMAVLFGIALALGQVSFIDLPVLLLTIAVVHLASAHVGDPPREPLVGCAGAQARSCDKPGYQDR